jgi:hypothetical protein
MHMSRRAIVAPGLLAIAAMSVSALSPAFADDKPVSTSFIAPTGTNPAIYRIPGVRASPTLGTAVHCTILQPGVTTVIVTFYEYDGTLACSVGSSGGNGATRTLTTGATAAFAEDGVCASGTTVGQGYATVATTPERANVVCSAQLVSLAGTAPTTLGALDVYRAP